MNDLDASALLALINNEPGADEVFSNLDSTLLSSVNLSEILQKSAEPWPLTKAHGASLADRACLALAHTTGGIAVTADRAWADLDIPGVAVYVITR